ncbi:MAG: PTS transporter subunit EIIC [Eubacteriales bacterium]
MKKVIATAFDKFIQFASLKSVTALKDGFVAIMPATLIGSIFLLISDFPISGFADFMEGIFGPNWSVGLDQVSANTFNIVAILAVISIAYNYANNEEKDGLSCGILALIAYLIVTESSIVTTTGEIVTDVIPMAWIGGNGLITAIIIGLFSGKVFVFCYEKNLRIKMPEGVPQGVSNAFSALIPGFIILLSSMIVYQGFKIFADTSFTEIIFTTIQIPLQNVSSTWLGCVIIVTLMSLLFWAGIHGPNIVIGVISPVLVANQISNQALMDVGMNSLENGSRILTSQLLECYVKLSGTGITIGLILAALIAAKSKQMKQLSKLAIGPAVFNINEPVIFGLPIVYNPIMLFPFILVPLTSFFITYGAAIIGFLQPFGNVNVPWTTPAIISGFILAGWRGAVVQVLVIIASVIIYYPFMMKQDKIFLAQEKEYENNN